MIEKKLWIHNIVENLKELASEEFQLKGWVLGEVHDYCSYEETLCSFLTDSDIEGFLENAPQFGLTEIQIQKIDDIKKALDNYDRENFRGKHYEHGFANPLDITKDPEWHKIRKMAQEALVALGITHYLDPSKAVLKEAMLNKIQFLSDLERQRDICSREHIDYNPLLNTYTVLLDPCKINNIISQYKDYEITESQISLVRELWNALQLYKQTHEEELKDMFKALSDPEWKKIQVLAEKVIKEFNYIPI